MHSEHLYQDAIDLNMIEYGKNETHSYNMLQIWRHDDDGRLIPIRLKVKNQTNWAYGFTPLENNDMGQG